MWPELSKLLSDGIFPETNGIGTYKFSIYQTSIYAQSRVTEITVNIIDEIKYCNDFEVDILYIDKSLTNDVKQG